MSSLDVRRKFTMLSTKEWMNYFQQKLSPERERDLMEQAESDPFLNEALKSLSNTEVRPIAYQSFNTLIHQIEDATGISESVVMTNQPQKSISIDSDNAKGFNYKIILLAIAVILLLGLITYGVVYFINESKVDSVSMEDENPIEAQSTDIDMSNSPFEEIPSDNMQSDPSMGTSSSEENSQNTSSQNQRQSNSNGNHETYSSVESYYNENVTTTTTSSQQESRTSRPSQIQYSTDQFKEEKEKFQRAQDLYKQGKMEESKRILNELKSYENPMKGKSAEILKNIDK